MAIVSSGIKDSDFSKSRGRERLIDPRPMKDEDNSYVHEGLRPKSFQDFVGQSKLKEILSISVNASIAREDALDHVLLYGPPGLGKTTMAFVLAQELGVKCRISSAPALERPRDIVGLLVNLKPREVLFIDEIHRLTKVAEELLYPAMEDLRLDLNIGKGSTSRTRSIQLAPFTLVGATTRAGSISSPLRDRFGIVQRFDFYSLEELQEVVHRSREQLALNITNKAEKEIARRCRGTPRIANRLLKRVRDFATVKKSLDLIDDVLVNEALNLNGVDEFGLDPTDRKLLNLLLETHQGGPVGVETLAAGLGEDPATLEFVVEPFLLQIGFLQRTMRGRVLSEKGKIHLMSS